MIDKGVASCVEISKSNPLEIFLHYLVYFSYLFNY